MIIRKSDKVGGGTIENIDEWTHVLVSNLGHVHSLCPPMCRRPTVSQCDRMHCITEILLMEAEPQAMSH